ncbi:MAG: Sir2 silent information regulator family NAD-dependent deacetylase, partial [Actinomyces sp.]
DFIARYGFTDAYTAGFHPFASPEEKWAYWSRHISLLRYETGPGRVYADLLAILDGRDFFVLTTNVDHRFQRAGFPKDRLFYTQGDYGLLQCSGPCHDATYDNEGTIRAMVERQRDMRVPTGLVPHCPRCGEPMSTNLRVDATFVQDAGWHTAADRCARWLRAHGDGRVLYLELGVGTSTPAIIRHPFWQRTYLNERAAYAGISLDPVAPREIAERSVLIDADLAPVLARLACRGATSTGPQTSGRPSGTRSRGR